MGADSKPGGVVLVDSLEDLMRMGEREDVQVLADSIKMDAEKIKAELKIVSECFARLSELL